MTWDWLNRNLSVVTKWFIYVSIAVLSAILGDTATSSLPGYWAIGLNATLQGVIAWRAFLDESMAWHNIEKKEKK